MWMPRPPDVFGKPRVAEVVEQDARLGGDAHGVGEVGAGLGVEVDAQLVGMVDVLVAHRPRMERDGAHLRRPADDGDLGRADLVGVPARRERDPRGLDVVGGSARDALLEEGVAAALLPRREHDARVHALGPPLERRRTPRERAHDPVLDGEVVLDDVELGHGGRALGRREDHAIGAAHAQLASPGVDGRALLRCHGGVLRECAAAANGEGGIRTLDRG